MAVVRGTETRPALSAGRAAALAALICAALTAVAYLVPFGQVNQALDNAGADALGIQATNLTGGGFWLALIGAVITAVGAIMQLVTARTR